MIAVPAPPLATPTMTASAVATKSALPNPHPARKPTSSPTLPDMPESEANTTITASPASRVRLPPIRDEMKPVTSIATAVIRK
jgi:hypothetical protein